MRNKQFCLHFVLDIIAAMHRSADLTHAHPREEMYGVLSAFNSTVLF
jgi:hypothetical protein